jgi:hypothetical protein
VENGVSLAAKYRTLEKLLLKLCLGDLDLDSLVDLLLVAALVVGIVLDRGGEERVDEGRLAKARFASNLETRRPVRTCSNDRYYSKIVPYHNSECSAPLRNDLVSLVGEIGNANR